MAYASKELKAKVLGLIKDHAKKSNIKLSVSAKITNCTTLSVNVSACSIDLKGNLIETLTARIKEMESSGIYGISEYEQLQKCLMANVNRCVDDMEFYGLEFSDSKLDQCFSGEALAFVQELKKAVLCDYHNNSDPYTDYFDHAYYWDFYIGKNKGGFIHKS